jgi:drug/metabolite transporter (DMT)-like permease
MTAVLFALASALTFGTMTVAIRVGLRDGADVLGSALATLLPAFAVALLASLVRHDYGDAWRFWLAGLLAPGISQLLFTLSVREVGASRTSIAVGAAPLVALAIAFLFLGEPIEAGLIAGGLIIVAGGVVLASERDRPVGLRARGLLYAAAAAVLFAVRDNIVRALHAHGSPETVAAATLLAGTMVAIGYTRRIPTRTEFRRLGPAGVLFGISYICLFEAYFHGRVSVVSPLVATESLWSVGLSTVVFRGSEGVGLRLILGALCVVVGGIVIGVTR